MSALICGSMAYDNIMVFPDRFKEHILPEKVHILNVCFLVPQMRKEFGGCAGNIAYNLHLLGGDGLPMATVGQDFNPYSEWMNACGIDQKYIKSINNEYTAQAFITTDLDDNQITAFHPGSMNFAQENKIPVNEGISIVLISPDGKDGMVQHAQQCVDAGIPFMFDPGQGLPMFDGKTIEIPAVKASDVKDPTGCGDAYRGGLIYGLMNNLGWEVTGRIAALMGSIKVAHNGTQNHKYSLTEFKDQYKKEFGQSF